MNKTSSEQTEELFIEPSADRYQHIQTNLKDIENSIVEFDNLNESEIKELKLELKVI
jgi:hypothetical protein